MVFDILIFQTHKTWILNQLSLQVCDSGACMYKNPVSLSIHTFFQERILPSSYKLYLLTKLIIFPIKNSGGLSKTGIKSKIPNRPAHVHSEVSGNFSNVDKTYPCTCSQYNFTCVPGRVKKCTNKNKNTHLFSAYCLSLDFTCQNPERQAWEGCASVPHGYGCVTW